MSTRQDGQTIREYLQTFRCPDYNCAIRPPQPVNGVWPTLRSNTVHGDYNPALLPPIVHWTIGHSEVSPFDRMLASKIRPIHATSMRCQSLRHFMRDSYTVSFNQEDTLVHRLAATLFLELDRLFCYISSVDELARANPERSPWYSTDAHYKPIFPEIGANAWLAKSVRDGTFVPDRAAVEHREAAQQTPRLLGDVKLSFKFQSVWKGYASSDIVGLRRAQAGEAAHQKPALEYRKVIAQLFHYMKSIYGAEDVPLGNTARYGYIVTDEEVVLVKLEREPRKGTVQLMITDGFPLRPRNGWQGWSGMMALAMIHFMASHNEKWLFEYN